MAELLLALTQQLNSSVFTLLIILCVAFWLVAKIFKYIGKYEERFSGFSEQFKEIKSELKEFRKEISNLVAKVTIMYNERGNSIAKTESPMQITDYGQKLRAQIKADEIIERIYNGDKQNIHKIVVGDNKNAYDIQTNILRWANQELSKFLSEEQINDIKNIAFTEGILVEDIYTILGLLIRDKIFQELNITVPQAHKHNPNKK